MTYDAADGYVLWFGGDCGDYGCNQTAAFQNGTWRNISTNTAPAAQFNVPIVYDAMDGYVLLQGGWGYNCYAYSEYECNQTWEYKAGIWTQLVPRCFYLGQGYGPCALPEGYFPMVYDGATGNVFLDAGATTGVSEVTPAGDYGPWVYSSGTWTYLGVNFTSGAKIDSPNAQSLVYDASDGYVMAFGGTTSTPTLPGNIGDNYTWVWNGTDWSNESANTINSPPPRISTSMTYDGTDGNVLLYGGSSILCLENLSLADCDGRFEIQTAYADTWEYAGGQWTEINASSAPGFVREPYLAYDPVDLGIIGFNDYSCPTFRTLEIGLRTDFRTPRDAYSCR